MTNLLHFGRKTYQEGVVTNLAEQGKLEPDVPTKGDNTMGGA